MTGCRQWSSISTRRAATAPRRIVRVVRSGPKGSHPAAAERWACNVGRRPERERPASRAALGASDDRIDAESPLEPTLKGRSGRRNLRPVAGLDFADRPPGEGRLNGSMNWKLVTCWYAGIGRSGSSLVGPCRAVRQLGTPTCREPSMPEGAAHRSSTTRGSPTLHCLTPARRGPPP
jgi:hypothetical protein